MRSLLALLPFFSSVLLGADLTGPVRLWSFDDPTAPWTADGIAFAGMGMTTAPGIVGQAACFDGTSELRLDVGEDAFRSGLTCVFLVRPAAEQVSAGPVNLVSSPGRFLLRLDPVARGRQVSLFLDRDGTLEPRVSGPALVPEEWSQIIAVATPDRAYLWVNGIEYIIDHPGTPQTASGPLIVGGALPEPVSEAGFTGLIDQLELRDGPVGRLWLYERVLWPNGQLPPPRQDLTGSWTGLWGATVADSQIHLPTPASRVVSPPLAVAPEEALHLELATRSGLVGEVFLLGTKGFMEKRFRIFPDGQPHVYSVPLDGERLGDTIRGVSLRLPISTAADLTLTRLFLGPATATAEPAIALRAFAPGYRLSRPGGIVAVRALLANDGQGTGEAKLDLASPLPLLAGQKIQTCTLAPGEVREVQWQVKAQPDGRHELDLTLTPSGQRPFHAVTEVIVADQLPALPTLREGYPRAMDFRHLGPKNLDIQAGQSLLLVDLIGDKIEAARAFKKRYPDTCVLMQINDEPNGLWGTWFTVPREYALKEGLRCEPEVFPMPSFKGYWLLRPGAVLAADFPATEEGLTFTVPDPKRFLHARFGGNGASPHDALVYRTGADGPDWEHAEYVSITSVDLAAKEITVKRWPQSAVGTWLDFTAGTAMIAPSAGDIYRHRTWVPNLTKFCPRDPATGLDACEWWARHFAQFWHQRVARDTPHPDGLQFDWAPFHAHKADADCNLDGEPDGGDFAGISYWGLGMHRFFALLRSGGNGWKGVGEDTLLVADASSAQDQRSFALLNGSENEEFCGFGRPHAFSAQFDLYQLWCREARAPQVSYLQSRFPCDLYYGGDFDRASRRDNFGSVAKIRLALAAACMELGIHTYRTGGREDVEDINQSVTRRYDLDEYEAGREGRFNWLGKPLGPARRMPVTGLVPALGDTGNHGDILFHRFADETHGWQLGTHLPAVDVEPIKQEGTVHGLALRFGVTAIHGPRQKSEAANVVSPWSESRLQPKQEVSLACHLWTNPQFDEREGELYRSIPRKVAFLLESEDGQRTEPAELLVGESPRNIQLSFTVPGAGKVRVVCAYGADLGPVWINRIGLGNGTGDLMFRAFENGLVLLNGSLNTPFRFAVRDLDARPLRQLEGLLSPRENQGKAVGGSVEVPPQDARFLIVDRR